MKLHHYSDIPADNQISNCYHLEEDRKDLVKVNVHLLLTVKLDKTSLSSPHF